MNADIDLPGIDSAEYPYKALIVGADPDAATCIMWFDTDPLPFKPDQIQAMAQCLAADGHLLLLARDSATLDRVHAAAVMIAETILAPDRGTVQ
jgi:hypothetical protein